MEVSLTVLQHPLSQAERIAVSLKRDEHSIASLPAFPRIVPLESKILLTIVASRSGSQPARSVPLVHLTPASAILSFKATVRPASKSFCGWVEITRACLETSVRSRSVNCILLQERHLTFVAHPPPSTLGCIEVSMSWRTYIASSGLGM